MQNLIVHYLIADPDGTGHEVPADVIGWPEPGSTLGYDGPTVTIAARRVLTVHQCGPRGPRTRLGIAHVLLPMTPGYCPRIGQRVRYLRCGTVSLADVLGWDYVTAFAGGTVRGDALADPRYAARAVPGGMAVAVTESDIAAAREQDAEPVVCAGTGNHAGQSVDTCDECDREHPANAETPATCEGCPFPLKAGEVHYCDACRGLRHRTPAERAALGTPTMTPSH